MIRRSGRHGHIELVLADRELLAGRLSVGNILTTPFAAADAIRAAEA